MKYWVACAKLVVCLVACNNNSMLEQRAGTPAYKMPIVINSEHKAILAKNDTIFFQGKLFSGVLVECTSAADTFSKTSYLNGVQHGLYEKWFTNGQLMERRTYTHGQKNGWQLAFFENGCKRFQFYAKNDIYEGELKEWNVQGNVIHVANYQNGQETGLQQMWYDNGKIRANYIIKNGRRYGLLGTKNCTNVSDSLFIAN